MFSLRSAYFVLTGIDQSLLKRHPHLLAQPLIFRITQIPEHVVTHDQHPAIIVPSLDLVLAFVILLERHQLVNFKIVEVGQPLLELVHPVQHRVQRTDDQHFLHFRLFAVYQQGVTQSYDLQFRS